MSSDTVSEPDQIPMTTEEQTQEGVPIDVQQETSSIEAEALVGSEENQTIDNGSSIPATESVTIPSTEEVTNNDQETSDGVAEAAAEEKTEGQDTTVPSEGNNESKEQESTADSRQEEPIQSDPNEATESSEIPPLTIRPNKRKISHMEDFRIIDPTTAFTVETNKKKVPARIIDEFWEPLNKPSLASFEKILNIALTRTLERYGDNLINQRNGKLSKKTTEAQRIITKTWINPQDSESLLSRLSVTKLPTNDSVLKEYKSKQDDDNILSFDQLLRRKKFLETYLGAELKQLQQLEKTYNELNINYQLDSKYLQDFKKTTLLDISNMQRELNEKRRVNNIPLPPFADEYEDKDKHENDNGVNLNSIDDLNLQTANSSSNNKHFNPNKDEDTKELLNTLNKHLTSITTNTKGLKAFNNKLETLYNILDML